MPGKIKSSENAQFVKDKERFSLISTQHGRAHSFSEIS